LTRIVVRTPIAPVLSEPKAASTQINQLLHGHSADVISTEGPWLKVRGADGYVGWMHQGYTAPSEASDPLAWAWDVEGEMSMGCSVRDGRSLTLDLPLGAVVGEGHCIAGRSMELARRRETFPPTGDAIVASAFALFQGTYYQWGGITPWGADCSGMLQSIFALHGVHLLRDASQQATQGVVVEDGLEGLQAADLLFFSDREDSNVNHVALAASSSKLVHVALGRGGHSIESLDRRDDYTRALVARFRFAKRIVAN
jgi:cell wall-associated NlpC family hydrolase